MLYTYQSTHGTHLGQRGIWGCGIAIPIVEMSPGPLSDGHLPAPISGKILTRQSQAMAGTFTLSKWVVNSGRVAVPGTENW